MDISAIILAAGSGKRMNSKRNKILHKLCGRPLVEHVANASIEAGINSIYVVVGRDAEQVREELGAGFDYINQEDRLGTGHAVMQVEPAYRGETTVLILCGDTPLIRQETLRLMLETHRESEADATILTAYLDEPGDYGRIVRNSSGVVTGIIEAKDATVEQREIHEINTGFFCFKSSKLFAALKGVDRRNAQGEYYLTDVIALMASAGDIVASCELKDMAEATGINDRIRLAEAEGIMRRRITQRLMLGGVTFLQPETSLIDDTVQIGRDTVIYPGCIIQGRTAIGEDCQIGPGTHLADCEVADGVTIEHSVAKQSRIGAGCQIGPFAYLRPQTELADGVKVGDFVELKNAKVGTGSKIPHLSYVGDVTIGQRVNLGAGTILVNYDGKHKHHSVIEDGAFIGCNSNLISPVHIGQGAYVAAGSTITDDVPADALAIARERQVNKAEWGRRRRENG